MRIAAVLSQGPGELRPVQGWQLRRISLKEMDGRLPFRPSVFVVRLDNGLDAEELIPRIRNGYHQARILATGCDVPAEKAVRALRTGAHDYVEFSRLVPDSLPGILDRVAGMASAEAEAANGKMVSLVGPTGTGVTTVSLNLAASLSSPGAPVLLISPESDLPAYLYRVRYNYTLRNFLADAGDSNRSDIRGQLTSYRVKTRTGGEICLLTGPPMDDTETDEAGFPSADPEKMSELESFARSQFRYTIVDHGAVKEDGLLPGSDATLVVTDTIPPNVKRLRNRIARLPEAPAPELLVNKSTRMGEIRAEDVAQQLRFKSFHSMPYDAVHTGKAAAAGEPLVSRSPLTRLAWSFRRLAKNLSKVLQGTKPGESGA